ncbi:hypothetical protein PIB30_005007 [Stylosanthes scabra]|uniref:Uncharacterized protein n=1 Tax=Stylosanthes scabra TaxID=79078 RepID=A0ABU6Y0G6_9FABA|nr:hypothetical protein [Stylosanthes scabra]
MSIMNQSQVSTCDATAFTTVRVRRVTQRSEVSPFTSSAPLSAIPVCRRPFLRAGQLLSWLLRAATRLCGVSVPSSALSSVVLHRLLRRV